MRNRLSLIPRPSLRLRSSRFFAVMLSLALLDAVSPAHAGSALSAPIEEFNARLVQVMQAGKTLQFQQRYTLLASTITRTFDLAFLLQNAVGAHWAMLIPEQRAALNEAFQQYAVSLCAAYFDNYSGERFEIAGEMKTSGGDPIVLVKIWPGDPKEDVHTLSYVMRQAGSEWRATDVVMDRQISLAALALAQIRALLSNHGDAGLLSRLQQTTTELSHRASR
jgi:phospholipid transport system substrate-binding protein